MSAAVIGVIGVVAGALLAGLLNYQAERSRRLALARVAGSLIAAELGMAVKRLTGSIQTSEWWPGDLPSEIWKANAGPLAVEARRGLVEELANAYALLELWNIQRAESGDKRIDAGQLEELREDKERLAALSTRVKEVGVRPATARLRRPLKLVGAIAIAALLLAVAFVPHAKVTDATVAAALQAEIAGAQLVGCSNTADRWRCDVTYLPRPRGGCRGSAAHPLRPGRIDVELVSAARTACAPGLAAARPTSYEVAEGPDGPIATPGAAQGARRSHRAGVQLDLPEKNVFQRAAEWLFDSE